MSEAGKRILRERRAPKTFDSDVKTILNRMKNLTHMDMVAILTLRYYLSYQGSENSFTITQFRCQAICQIYQQR